MARRISSFLALALLAALGAAMPGSKDGVDHLVVGGEHARRKQFRDIVSLQTDGDFHFCAGTIIDKEWILTASHCLENMDPEDVTILAGTRDNLDNDKGVRRQAGEFIMHEDYGTVNGISLNHDVALIKLTEKIALSEYVRVGSLQKDPTKNGDPTVVAGWGRNSNFSPSGTRRLLYTDLEILGNDACKEAYSGFADILDNQVCAQAPKDAGIQAECNGDSGGPLYNKNGLVLGVVSWSRKPCGLYPGVFASVPKHISWIKEKTGLTDL